MAIPKGRGRTIKHSGSMGPFMYNEVAKSKTISGAQYHPREGKGRAVTAGNATAYARMSGKHGQHGMSKDNNMNRKTGGYMIGDTPRPSKGFGKADYRLAGPNEGINKTAQKGYRQPSGHKGQAGPN